MSNPSGDAKINMGLAPSAVPLGKNVLLLGVLLFTAVIFLPTLRYQFVYDDNGQIVSNPVIRSWRFVPQYFQGQVWQYLHPTAAGNYYRPVNVLWWRINYALFGLHSTGWHGSTIALHLLATALVFWIARRISGQPLVAAVTALLFGIHPTRHEVVAWISGSTESLLAVLFFSAFLAYLCSRNNRKIFWMFVSCAFYGAGLLAKETAIVLPALVFVHASLYGLHEKDAGVPGTFWRRMSDAAARTSIYVPLAALYLILRVHVLHGFSHGETVVTFSALLLTLPSVLFFYLEQWLLPLRISQVYDVAVQERWDLWHVLLPLMALVVAGALLWLLRRKLGPRELFFGLAAVALPLAPVLYISVLPIGEVVHDRYAYLPGFGAAFVTALGLQHLCRGKLILGLPGRLVLAMLAILLPLSYATASASSYWNDEFTLFRHSYQMAPQNITARINYAVALSRSGDKDAAIALLAQVAKEHPDSFFVNFNLGSTLYEVRRLPEAEHYLRVAQNLNPGEAGPYFQLGLVSLRLGRANDSVEFIRRAVSLRPDNPALYFALGTAMARNNDCRGARAEFGQALLLEPSLVAAQTEMDKCTGDTLADSQAQPTTVPHVQLPLVPVREH